MHTLNDQVFRGFFTGRYLFDSVTGFLRYASPAAPGGFGPTTVGCSRRRRTSRRRRRVRPARRRPADRCCSICRARRSTGRRPTPPAPRRSPTTSSRCSFRTSGSRAANLTINYGLRWDAQLMPETVDPQTTAYGPFLDDPGVPVRRHDPRPVGDVPAARRCGVGRQGRRQVRCCARAPASTPRARTC